MGVFPHLSVPAIAQHADQSPDERTEAQAAIVAADQTGDRKTLKADSFIPTIMAGIYLLLLIYFKSIGGYEVVHLSGASAAAVKES